MTKFYAIARYDKHLYDNKIHEDYLTEPIKMVSEDEAKDVSRAIFHVEFFSSENKATEYLSELKRKDYKRLKTYNYIGKSDKRDKNRNRIKIFVSDCPAKSHGERLSSIRQYRDLTRKAAGEISGVSKDSIKFYEQNVQNPNMATAINIYNLAKAYMVPISDILNIRE